MNDDRRSRREIAPAVVLDSENRFLLQQRDDLPWIVCPGMIGLFGGHREGDETFLECAVREVEEELSCVIGKNRIRFLCSREGDDLEVLGGTIRADFFLVTDISVDEVTVTEGSLLVVEQADIAGVYDRLTPSAKHAIEFFMASTAALR